LGEVLLMATGYNARGFPADGRLVSIAQNTALFAVMGTTFGGDGQTTFAMPDLRLSTPTGIVAGICNEGYFPSSY
jgi:microcystin-dependent protein